MHLFDFAYCGNFPAQLHDLALLSPEKWSFGNKNDNSILRNYIIYTFLRLYDEGKIVESDDYAIFNTGLFDIYFTPIYAHFIRNSHPDKQKWFLDGFITDYQRATIGITEKPERANYFTNPADLVFDTHLQIVAQFEHIFGDAENKERLPVSMRNTAMAYPLFHGALAVTTKCLRRTIKSPFRNFIGGKSNYWFQCVCKIKEFPI